MPGMGLSAPMYASLAQELASHGYLVAGVTPTYSANLTILDGQTIASKEAANPANLGDSSEQAQNVGDHLVGTWAADARFAAGMLAKQLPNSVETGIGTSYVGHSFGGAASLGGVPARPAVCGGGRPGRRPSSVTWSPRACGRRSCCSARTTRASRACAARTPRTTQDRNRALSLLKASTGTSWCATVPGSPALQLHRLRRLLPGVPAAEVPAAGQRRTPPRPDRPERLRDHLPVPRPLQHPGSPALPPAPT